MSKLNDAIIKFNERYMDISEDPAEKPMWHALLERIIEEARGEGIDIYIGNKQAIEDSMADEEEHAFYEELNAKR